MDLRDYGALALVLVIGAFVIAIGAEMLETGAETFCDYTYGSYNSSPYGYAPGADPVSGSYIGCCQTINSTDNACTAWSDSAAYNVSFSGLDGMDTFGTWIPLIALVIVLTLIIGILIKQLGGTIGA